MNLSTPVAGLAQEGFTDPSIELAPDSAPSPNGKQWYVSGVSGMPDVTTHSVASPYTVSVFRPATIKVAGPGQATATGVVVNQPKNTYKVITRKAVTINSLGAKAIALVTTSIDVPVGTSDEDLAALKAAISLHGGALIQDPDQWWETAQTGAL